jgi:hypothetical protein
MDHHFWIELCNNPNFSDGACNVLFSKKNEILVKRQKKRKRSCASIVLKFLNIQPSCEQLQGGFFWNKVKKTNIPAGLLKRAQLLTKATNRRKMVG